MNPDLKDQALGLSGTYLHITINCLHLLLHSVGEPTMFGLSMDHDLKSSFKVLVIVFGNYTVININLWHNKSDSWLQNIWDQC